MTELHTQWALSHDWCIASELLPDGMIAITTIEGEREFFATFKALREWAGY